MGRGREYCVIYGWSSFDYSRNALVKKNVCDSSKDKVLYWENHYPTEMYFLAHPEGSDEDDLVLVSVSFDGELEKSYLLLLDAKISKKLIVLIYLSIFRILFLMECIFQTRSGLYKSMLISCNISISIYVLK